jgi:methionyl-tRNA formyltransferase
VRGAFPIASIRPIDCAWRSRVTPEFARVALERLQAAGHEIALVLCQPDRPAGRGMKIEPAPVKAFALEHGFALAQPRGLRLDGRFADDAAAARTRSKPRRPRRSSSPPTG